MQKTMSAGAKKILLSAASLDADDEIWIGIQ